MATDRTHSRPRAPCTTTQSPFPLVHPPSFLPHIHTTFPRPTPHTYSLPRTLPRPRHPLRTARSTPLTLWDFPRSTASPARCARGTPRRLPVEHPNGARRAPRHTRTPHWPTPSHPHIRPLSDTPTQDNRRRVTYLRATRCLPGRPFPRRPTKCRPKKRPGGTPVLSHRRGQCLPQTSQRSTTLAQVLAHRLYPCIPRSEEVDLPTPSADRLRAALAVRHAALGVQPHRLVHSASRRRPNEPPPTAPSQKTLDSRRPAALVVFPRMPRT